MRFKLALFVVVLAIAGSGSVGAAPGVDPGPTPRATCGPGSLPETGIQGRVSTADVDSGRAAKGYTCNTTLLSRYGTSGGLRVHRYVDPSGRECAYYDTTFIFPLWNLRNYQTPTPDRSMGVFVLDMSDSTKPIHTDTLLTPAMVSPHESLNLSASRGLLVAALGGVITYPGHVDIYDVRADCRHPVLKSSLPVAVLGHEGALSPDGNTYYVSSTGGHTITAVDISDPALPRPVWTTTDYLAHGMSVSDDGNRLYVADINDYNTNAGLTILDVSEVQRRVLLPTVPKLSHIIWPEVSIPQVPLPVTIGGRPYLVEIDEFTRALRSEADAAVGAARIIDIADERNPKVVSNIRLEVNMPEARTPELLSDPQAGGLGGFAGYTGHYCTVPQRNEPGVVACTFVLSGMRVFDIRDPLHPRELAYANFPTTPPVPGFTKPSSLALSTPAFVAERGEIWYTDGNSGFYAVKLTNGVWPFTSSSAPARAAAAAGASRSSAPVLPATGADSTMLPFVLMLVAAAIRVCVTRVNAPRTSCP